MKIIASFAMLAALAAGPALAAGDKAETPGTASGNPDHAGVMSHASSEAAGYDEDTIRQVQSALQAKGYKVQSSGEIDAETTEALKEYQREHNIGGTGALTQETVASLGVQPNDAHNQQSEVPEGHRGSAQDAGQSATGGGSAGQGR